MELQISVGKVLRAFRKKKKFTIEKIALKTNISGSYISKIERGNLNVSLDIIERYCVALDITIETFVEALNTSIKHQFNEDELNMVENYSKLNRKEKESIQFIMNRMILAKANQLSSDQND